MKDNLYSGCPAETHPAVSREERALTQDASSPGPDNNFGWLDVALVLARNLTWLIVLPILAAVLAHFVSNALPHVYTSTALISAEEAAEAQIRSATVLDEVLKTIPGPENSIDLRRKWLGEKLTLTRARNANGKAGDATPLVFSVTDDDARTANKIASALIASWLHTLKPNGAELKAIDGQIAIAETELASVDAAVKKLEAELGNGLSHDALVSLYALRRNFRKELLDLKIKREGRQEGQMIISAPTLPDDGVKKIRFAAPIAALLTILAIAAYALLRAVILNSATDRRKAEKLAQIRSALTPWARRT